MSPELRSHGPAPNTRPVAFFDFDGTLTTGDTLMPFLKYVVGAPVYYAKLALVCPVLAAYLARLLRNDITKQVVLKRFLRGDRITELRELGRRFSEEVLPTMLRPEGMERLRWHQAQGHECVLVSASLDLYLEHWVSKHAFDACFSSELEVLPGGDVSGLLKGENCFGDVKRQHVLRYLEGRSAECTYGYGDSRGDMPMLGALDKGYRWNGSGFVAVSS